MRICALLLLVSGCSFVLVKDVPHVPAGADPTRVDCTGTALVPGLDAIGGAAALATAAGGIILQHTSDDGHPQHFTTYYAGPLLLLSIVYFYAAAGGTERVTNCKKLHERSEEPEQIRPIDMGPPKPKPKPDDIEITP